MNLNIDVVQTEKVGSQIIEKAAEFKKILAAIKNENDKLKSAWEGTDANSYATAVSEEAAIMDQLQVTIEKAGTFLQQAAAAYKSVADNNIIK